MCPLNSREPYENLFCYVFLLTVLPTLDGWAYGEEVTARWCEKCLQAPLHNSAVWNEDSPGMRRGEL